MALTSKARAFELCAGRHGSSFVSTELRPTLNKRKSHCLGAKKIGARLLFHQFRVLASLSIFLDELVKE